jgi:hypothetical protein
MSKYQEEQVKSMIGIGFCQPRFYRTNEWRRAKRFMDNVVCPAGFATPCNYGRGRGKYSTQFDIAAVKQKTVNMLRSQGKIIEPAS